MQLNYLQRGEGEPVVLLHGLFGSAANLHLMAESMRRAFADRARYQGDPDFNPDIPVERLTSKAYAAQLAKTIEPKSASVSSPGSFGERHGHPGCR